MVRNWNEVKPLDNIQDPSMWHFTNIALTLVHLDYTALKLDYL